MSEISRSDMHLRSEKGPDWFNDFLRVMSNQNPSTVKDIMNTINDKRGETVEGIVENYREQVGLDSLGRDDEAKEQVKEAQFRPLSKRHAKMGPSHSSLPKLKENPEVLKDIDSLCEHSGGTKNTHSIMAHLRDKFGKELVSFSDSDLKEFIEERKSNFHNPAPEEEYDVGLVGQEKKEDFQDDIADYQTHDGVMR